MANKMETGLKGRWTFYFDNMEADQINAPQRGDNRCTTPQQDKQLWQSAVRRRISGIPKEPEAGTGNQPIPTFVG